MSSINFRNLIHVFDNVIKDPCRAIDEVLGNFVEEEYRIETFNLDPLQLYTSIYGKPIETPEKALQDEQVSQVLSNSLSFLAKWSELITNALFMTYKLPRSAIYICVQLEAQLRYYFPSASSAEVEQMVAQFAYEVFLSRSLSSTKNQVRALGKQPSADAFQKLDCILQFVGFAVLNRGYGNNKWYLTSLNKQIHTIHKDFTKFVKDSARGVSLDDVYGLNEYTQFDPFQKPTLSLLEKHVYTVVEQLQKNATIKELISTLIASAKVSPSGENDKTILLQLHPSPTERVVNGIDVQEFARAKKLVVDLLLCELAGSTLPQLLNASPTVSNEELHKSLFGDDQITSIREKQRNLNESLNNLEKDGRSSSSDNYQSVVTDIANDIRLHARRQRERAEQKKSVQEAREKLLVQREELKAKLAQYEEYLETCLQNLTRTSRRLSFRPVTEKAGKIQKQRASLDQAKSYKSSAEKLFRKGILVDVIGIQTPKQMSKLSVEIGSTADLGIFSVSLLDSNKTVETHLLEFQDLLKADSNEEQKYMLQDRVVFDVPHLIQYINKKFFNK
ncbi:unnamed protein product [Caenorhabditis auriculariae]|uniref:Ras-GAP domain-containing protein n=1 Tax=Caenorhabditis auriculariae TaxID=2777116 RepID=A0A8S1H660_9PELO|nr:unnamed protein product [Caenorhabditis auriculariae]